MSLYASTTDHLQQSLGKDVITTTQTFFLCLKLFFQLFNRKVNENQYQNTYKLEEISRKHYLKNFFPQ